MAQGKPAQPAKPEPSPTPPSSTFTKLDGSQTATAEQVVENAIVLYGFGAGRAQLDQIRKTTIEKGKTTTTDADGKTDQFGYQKFIIRGATQSADKVRIDHDVRGAKYSLIYSDDKISGLYNNQVFSPLEDASKNFDSSLFHSVDALLRYKEDGATLGATVGRDKILGVDHYIIDLTDKAGRKTRYYLSAKSFRVMMLTYDEGGVTYKRKFYDQRYTQGTLVAYHTVLYANDKIVEESDVNSVVFGQKVDDTLFVTAG